MIILISVFWWNMSWNCGVLQRMTVIIPMQMIPINTETMFTIINFADLTWGVWYFVCTFMSNSMQNTCKNASARRCEAFLRAQTNQNLLREVCTLQNCKSAVSPPKHIVKIMQNAKIWALRLHTRPRSMYFISLYPCKNVEKCNCFGHLTARMTKNCMHFSLMRAVTPH